jgi:glycosyltransferase involved in cell wall biosynthesis
MPGRLAGLLRALGRTRPIKVSVVIATYNSGPDIDRTVTSLDQQTLPADQFEVILVDDGSTDGTFEHLRELCASRPHFQLDRIPNSGWPGRPRNLGTARASGEYVLYMDHDDELFPAALERMYDYAAAHDADVLLGKETMYGDGRTPGWPTWRSSQARAKLGHAVLHCMTPHKLYRRSLIRSAPLKFPEGPIRFEDQYFNHTAYGATDKLSILADYPCYRWRIHKANSHRAEVDLNVYLSSYLRSLEPVAALPDSARRNEMFKRSYVRVILARLGPGDNPFRERFMADADLISEHIPLAADELLEPVDRVRSVLFRRAEWRALDRLRAFHDRFTLGMHGTSAEWQDGVLTVRTEGVMQLRGGEPYPVRWHGDSWHLELPNLELTEPIGSVVTDIEESLSRAYVDMSVYGRNSGVEWPVPSASSLRIVEGGIRTVSFSVEGAIEPQTGAMGGPLEDGVWDLMVQFSALGHEVRRRIPARGMTARQHRRNGRTAVAGPVAPGNLALTLSSDAAAWDC